MNEDVGEEVDRLVPQRLDRGASRLQHRRVTESATGAREEVPTTADRVRATGRVRGWGGRCQESLEESELLDRVQAGRRGRDLGVGDVVGDRDVLALRVLLALLLKQLVRDPHLDV